MPMVGMKKFAYTSKGKKEAKEYAMEEKGYVENKFGKMKKKKK